MRSTPLLARRLIQLVLGLVAYGVGIALMVRAAVGVAPWDVLAQGIARVSGLEFGLVTSIVGAGVLLLWIPLRQRPGLGTVLNVLILGASAGLVLGLVPAPDSLLARIPLFAGGLSLVAVATGAYIGAAFGPGPRDGLMTGLHALTGLPIWLVRTAIEVSVLAVGWVLGGDVGIGTIAFALLIGPMAQPALRWFDLRDRVAAQPAGAAGGAATGGAGTAGAGMPGAGVPATTAVTPAGVTT